MPRSARGDFEAEITKLDVRSGSDPELLIASTSSPVHPPLQTYRCVAVNRRFGPGADNMGLDVLCPGRERLKNG
jgi:hypothetical protein